jgi:hypothetical protein
MGIHTDACMIFAGSKISRTHAGTGQVLLQCIAML